MKYVIGDTKPEEVKKVELIQKVYGVEVVVDGKLLCYLNHENKDENQHFVVWDSTNSKWLYFSDKGLK